MAAVDATNGADVKVKQERTVDPEEVAVTGGDLDPDSQAKKEDDKDKDKIKDEKKIKSEDMMQVDGGAKAEGVKGEGVKGEGVKGEKSVKQELGGTKGESVKGEGAKNEGTKGEQVKGEGVKGESKKEGAIVKPEMVKNEMKKERSGSRGKKKDKKDKKVKREQGASPGRKEKKKKDKKDKKRARSGSAGKDRKRKSKWGPDVPQGFSMTAIPGGRSGMGAITDSAGEHLPRFNADEMIQRTVLLDNLPSHVTGQELVEFFNGAVLAVTANAVQQAANKTQAPVYQCTVMEEDHGDHRRKVAELKFRTPDGASVGMKLNGIEYRGGKIIVKRPDGFPMEDGDPATKINLHEMSMAKLLGGAGSGKGLGSDGVSPKLSIFNLPESMSEQIVRDLLSQFGKLRMMSLIRDLATGKIKGYGIFEYDDPNDVELAILALNGFVCGQNVIRVQKLGGSAQQGNAPKAQPVAATAMSNSMTQKIVSNPVLAMQVKQGREIGSRATTVVQLLNAVYQEDLMDDQDYDDIMSEVHNMASKHGTVSRVIIPKPAKDGASIDGVGKVFVSFQDMTAARKFQLDCNGRKFEHRVVCAAFYPVEKFTEGKYKLWSA